MSQEVFGAARGVVLSKIRINWSKLNCRIRSLSLDF